MFSDGVAYQNLLCVSFALWLCSWLCSCTMFVARPAVLAANLHTVVDFPHV
jgi:hypothetical protein